MLHIHTHFYAWTHRNDTQELPMPTDQLNTDTHKGLTSPYPPGFREPTLQIICAVSAACDSAANAFLSLG